MQVRDDNNSAGSWWQQSKYTSGRPFAHEVTCSSKPRFPPAPVGGYRPGQTGL